MSEFEMAENLGFNAFLDTWMVARAARPPI